MNPVRGASFAPGSSTEIIIGNNSSRGKKFGGEPLEMSADRYLPKSKSSKVGMPLISHT